MIYYPKTKISQKKINNIKQDLEKYVNLETWEYLDILTEETEEDYIKKFIKINYKFAMINKEINNKFIIDKIWITYYWYLCYLITNLKTDNTINYNLLELNNAWLNKLKWVFKKNWIVKFHKLIWDKKSKYYLNPYISSYDRLVRLELVDLFKKENKDIYWINKL